MKPSEIRAPNEEGENTPPVIAKYIDDVIRKIIESETTEHPATYSVGNLYRYLHSYAHLAIMEKLGYRLRFANWRCERTAIQEKEVYVSIFHTTIPEVIVRTPDRYRCEADIMPPTPSMLPKKKFMAYLEAMRRIRDAIERIVADLHVEEENVDVGAKVEEYVKDAASFLARHIVGNRIVLYLPAAPRLLKAMWHHENVARLAAQGWDTSEIRMWGGIVTSTPAIYLQAPNGLLASISIEYKPEYGEVARYAERLLSAVQKHMENAKSVEVDVGPVRLVNIKYCRPGAQDDAFVNVKNCG